MPSLINMQMDPEEVKEQVAPTVDDAPKYPWGLQIDLDDGALEKLNLEMPEVGETINIIAKATCTRCSSNQTQGGETETCCTLQITDMQAVSAEPDSSSLYPSMKQ